MKLRRLFAATTAAAVMASAMAVTSFAAVFEGSDSGGQFVCLVSNDSNVPVLENSALAADITKLVLTVKCADYRDLNDTIANAEWYGGGIGTNSTSTGWAQKEWSFQDGVKDFTFVAGENRGEYVLTWDNGAPFFTTSEEYAFFWIQDWTGTYSFAIQDYQLLNADGVDVRSAASTDDAPADDTPADDTPAEDTAEAEDEDTTEVEETVEAGDVDWDAYDADAMADMNANFVFGTNDQIDIYDLVGDDWANLAKVEGTFVWTDLEAGWCGGGGIGGGAILADGSNWLGGPEYGAANANAAVVGDGVATQTIIDITDNPMTAIATYDAETGETSFGKIFVQNWWNGVESGVELAAITAYDADGNVIGEITYDVEIPEASTGDNAADTDAPTDDNKGTSPDTGVAGVASVAGIVVLAGAAVVASRKRK